MSRFFLHIFDWMEKHRSLMYASLVIFAGIFIWGISRLSFDEDVTGFFAADEALSSPAGIRMLFRTSSARSGEFGTRPRAMLPREAGEGV